MVGGDGLAGIDKVSLFCSCVIFLLNRTTRIPSNPNRQLKVKKEERKEKREKQSLSSRLQPELNQQTTNKVGGLIKNVLAGYR